MYVVYADSLFLINLVINYILLLVTAKICAVRTARLRLLGAAVLGASYSVVVVLPLLPFLESPFIKVAVGLFMVMVSFGGQPRLLRLALVFLAVSVAFGGAVMAVSMLSGGGIYGGLFTTINMRVLILVFAVCYAVLTLVFRRAGRFRGGGGVVPVVLRHQDREVHIRALIDTGNALTDPMTGRGVIIAGVTDVTPLLPLTIRKTVAGLRLKDAVKVLEELSAADAGIRFQLVPYSAVGTAGGMLLAFKPDHILINGKNKTGMLLALSPNCVSESGTYSALLGA